jgi:hypothetical protein
MPDDAEEEDLQRVEVVRRVSSLPACIRATWSTKSTLQVQVDETSTERFDAVCTVLTRYATLRHGARATWSRRRTSEQCALQQCAALGRACALGRRANSP